ncbi:hypothetical protein K469DRAFT_683467 [Zopfia rhizophila CBS 207.26]|uniref:Uncharacterized protein n=1 Tax=Zopfia rhizophila CBS 207.26 TaxID=1314779 RepID=A0A6A6DBB5_9PEZI|nr:hypothetical protein K469DRAFT_683467 [Zopfia rhizophila CBS 207.26]
MALRYSHDALSMETPEHEQTRASSQLGTAAALGSRRRWAVATDDRTVSVAVPSRASINADPSSDVADSMQRRAGAVCPSAILSAAVLSTQYITSSEPPSSGRGYGHAALALRSVNVS